MKQLTYALNQFKRILRHAVGVKNNFM